MLTNTRAVCLPIFLHRRRAFVSCRAKSRGRGCTPGTCRDSLLLLVQSGLDVALATLPGLSKPSKALLAKARCMFFCGIFLAFTFRFIFFSLSCLGGRAARSAHLDFSSTVERAMLRVFVLMSCRAAFSLIILFTAPCDTVPAIFPSSSCSLLHRIRCPLVFPRRLVHCYIRYGARYVSLIIYLFILLHSFSRSCPLPPHIIPASNAARFRPVYLPVKVDGRCGTWKGGNNDDDPKDCLAWPSEKGTTTPTLQCHLPRAPTSPMPDVLTGARGRGVARGSPPPLLVGPEAVH